MPPDARGRPATAALDVRPAPTDTNEASIIPAAITGLLKLSDERDLYLRRLPAAGREAFACGRALGSDEGYAQAEEDMAWRWEEIPRPVVRGLPLAEIGRGGGVMAAARTSLIGGLAITPRRRRRERAEEDIAS